MQDLIAAIPDAEVLLALPPEELGAKLLFLARRRLENQTPNMGMIHPGNMTSEMTQGFAGNHPGYPRNLESQVMLAVSEAWAWLKASSFRPWTSTGGTASGSCHGAQRPWRRKRT